MTPRYNEITMFLWRLGFAMGVWVSLYNIRAEQHFLRILFSIILTMLCYLGLRLHEMYAELMYKRMDEDDGQTEGRDQSQLPL